MFTKQNLLLFTIFQFLLCGPVYSQSIPVGPGKSLLWGHYNNFDRCYTWFSQVWNDDGSRVKPKVMEYNNKGCSFINGLRNKQEVVRKIFDFPVVEGETDYTPNFHFQSAHLEDYLRNPAPGESGFRFGYSKKKGSTTPTFVLYNDGRFPHEKHDFCKRQQELSLTFYDDQMLKDRNGEAYKVKNFKKLRLTFDAKMQTKRSVCSESEGQVVLFKPSILFDLKDKNDKWAGMNAMVIDMKVKERIPKVPGKINEDLPEIIRFNKCKKPLHPDRLVCTIHTDESVFQTTDLGDGWKRYTVDLMPYINRYVENGYFRGKENAPFENSNIRALQFIATQTGGLAHARIKNINLTAARQK